jgi:sugar/nucleoside kinase (ribokinase family)
VSIVYGEVVCLGALVLDVFLKPVVSLPAAERLELVDHLEVHGGGCANNTAIGLARLGHSVHLIGKVGQDIFGDFIIRNLQREGVGVQHIHRSEDKATSTTLVLVDHSGQRGLLHYQGANADLGPDDLELSMIRENAKVLHVAGANILPGLDGERMRGILSRAKKSKILTCVDTAWNPDVDFAELIGPVLPHTDTFLPNIYEASMITAWDEPEEMARSLLDKGVGTVGLKMGRKGCLVANANEMYHLPTFNVETVDTAGAGDAFVAGFLAGNLRGLPLRETAQVANAMGALATASIGCTTGLPTWDKMANFMGSASLLIDDE